MPSSNEIVSKMKNLTDILMSDSNAYFIPDYQRGFVWGEDEISQLWEDMLEDSDSFSIESSELEGYLLGNIVLIDKGSKKEVVDGQQRLTALSLMAKALYETIDNYVENSQEGSERRKWTKKLGDLSKAFVIEDDEDVFQGLKIQHDSSLSFGSYYRKLIEGANESSDIEKTEDQNIDEVYKYLSEKINELTKEQVQRFTVYFKTKIKLIETTAPSEAKAFQLFEVLNDRGRSLEPMDLIKNLFLKTLNVEGKSDAQIEDFTNNWQKMMDNLQITPKRRVSSSTFLKHFLIAFKGENLKAEKLFKYFKEKSDSDEYNGKAIINLAKQLKKVSEIYKNIEKKNYDKYLNDNNMFVLFRILKIKQFIPLLLMIYEESDEKKKKLLDTLCRLGAAFVFSYTQTNEIEKMLPDLTTDYWGNYKKNKELAFNNMIETLDKKISELSGLVKSNIEDRIFVNNKGDVVDKANNALRFVEMYFNQNTKIMSPPTGRKITVEHIMPRNLDDPSELEKYGFDTEEERRDYLNRFGNLSLLYNDENSSAGNGSFTDKTPIYENTEFVLTSTLVKPKESGILDGNETRLFEIINNYEKVYSVENDYWDKTLIETRSKDMADFIVCILKNSFDE